uniref:DDE_Tnp_1_7 domain-containing protein n=1 Tax=Haemonchus placei TaxID=6290 RepID=A0A0N4VRW7_HAEPC
MEVLENSLVQLLSDSAEEANNEDVSGAPDGLLADAVESSDDEDSEEKPEAGWSSTIVKSSVVPSTEDSGIQNDNVYAFSNPMSFYKIFMTDELMKLVNEENRYGSARYPTWSVLEEQEFYKFSAICFHMNIEKRSVLKEYWSTRIIYSGSFAARLMTRYRFIETLNSLHFATSNKVSSDSHTLRTPPGPKREHSSRCVKCYKKLAEEHGAPYARSKASQLDTKCSKCRKYYCLNCYRLYHKKCSGSLE